MTNILKTIWLDSGFSQMSWQTAVMLILACVLLYLGIVKKYEPLLMIGIAFGMLLTNLPGANLYHPELWDRFLAGEIGYGTILHDGGLLDILYIGVKSGVYPSLIFLGVGAMTDFGPLIANPKVCCWAPLRSWACMPHSGWQLFWAFPVRRPRPSVS